MKDKKRTEKINLISNFKKLVKVISVKNEEECRKVKFSSLIEKELDHFSKNDIHIGI